MGFLVLRAKVEPKFRNYQVLSDTGCQEYHVEPTILTPTSCIYSSIQGSSEPQATKQWCPKFNRVSPAIDIVGRKEEDSITAPCRGLPALTHRRRLCRMHILHGCHTPSAKSKAVVPHDFGHNYTVLGYTWSIIGNIISAC